MRIRQLFDPTSSTYTYLLSDPMSGRAVLIDPVDTRDTIGLCLALAARQDEPERGPGLVYRM